MSVQSLQSESTLTDRYQTTVPHIVRETLQLSKRDKIKYIVHQDNTVVIAKVDVPDAEDDPVVGRFLDFLAKDMTDNPHHIKNVSGALVDYVKSIVEGVEIDLDAPLGED